MLKWLTREFRLRHPWGVWLGVARTLIALGTAGTLIFTPTDALFRPVRVIGEAPLCHSTLSIGIFCVVPEEQLAVAKWLCVAILLLVASGWRPRLTGIPHWWISFSVASNIAIPDGGDHAAAVLTLLLIPVALTDRRRWHWQRSNPSVVRGPWAVGVAVVMCFVLRVQISIIYFQASVSKWSRDEWADGTSVYYWLNSVTFGVADWLRPATDILTGSATTVALLTWMPLAIELALGLSLLLSTRVRWILLPIGIGFHLSIAIAMGLWSFSLVMFGALILLLVPYGRDVNWHDSVVREWLARLRHAWHSMGTTVTRQSARPDQG